MRFLSATLQRTIITLYIGNRYHQDCALRIKPNKLDRTVVVYLNVNLKTSVLSLVFMILFAAL